MTEGIAKSLRHTQMGHRWSDEGRREEARNETEARLKREGYAPLSDTNSHVPDFPNNSFAIAFWVNASNKSLPNKIRMEAMKQPFTIGTREPLSYSQRKKMSLLSPDNPFSTSQSEAEAMVLDKISQNLPLKKGGVVRHHFEHHHRHQKRLGW